MERHAGALHLKGWLAAAVLLPFLPAGCRTPAPPPPPPVEEVWQPPVLKAAFAAAPVVIDGALDDVVWQQAVAYPLSLSKDQTKQKKAVAEAGEIRLAWDRDYFYVAANFTDSDVIAEGDEDQLHHYQLGDLLELFLKPDSQTWYWELYATPKGKKTSFWFPGRGRLGLPSSFDYACGLAVAARVDGTLNDWHDSDNRWTAEMRMPVKDLTAQGDAFGPGSAWRILVARYNFSRYLPWKELSMAPALSRSSYHLCEEYGTIEFER